MSAWQFYMSFFSRQYGKIFWTTFVSACQTFIIIPSLLLVKYAFDVVIPANDITLLILIGIGIFLLRLVNSLVTISLRNLHIKVINRSIYLLRESLLHKLYKISYLFYTNSDLRTLQARIVQDTERLGNMSSALISRLLPSLIIGFGLLIVCFILNPHLLLIIIALIPILIITNRMMGRKIKKRVFIFQRAFEEFSKGVYFVLKYLPLTTIQSAQKEEIERQKKVLSDLQEKTGRMANLFSVNLQLQETLTGLTAIVIIIVGGISVAKETMTLGEFLSFYLAAMYLNKYVNTITSSIPDVIAGNVSLNTLYDLSIGDDFSGNFGEESIEFNGDIELRDVSFSYGNKQVLKSIDLKIDKGERIAIIGANGSGKTTILNLITGMLTVERGEILASGCPLKDLDIIEYRKQLGVVGQYPPLFPGTIKENIIYGSDSIDMEHLENVSRLSLAYDFVKELPDGFDTYIGDDGVLLSGGEGQRVAIARALYRNPKLLILDEPTNHLDKDAIGKIMENLRNIKNNPTVLLISHEKSVINFAHKIYLLKDGVLERY